MYMLVNRSRVWELGDNANTVLRICSARTEFEPFPDDENALVWFEKGEWYYIELEMKIKTS